MSAMTTLERVAKWMRHFRESAERERREAAQAERERARRIAARREAEAERMAKILARSGVYFEGDQVDAPRAPEVVIGPRSGEGGEGSGGEAGPWYGWLRFPR
jgi:bisphosphoglycerate-dependent phosphoglycerate mutase